MSEPRSETEHVQWSEDVEPRRACPECGDPMPAGPDGRRICDNAGCRAGLAEYRAVRRLTCPGCGGDGKRHRPTRFRLWWRNRSDDPWACRNEWHDFQHQNCDHPADRAMFDKYPGRGYCGLCGVPFGRAAHIGSSGGSDV